MRTKTGACRKAKKEIKMLSSVSVIFKASVSKRLLITLISLYIFTEVLSFQHAPLLDKTHFIYKFEKHVRADLRALKQSSPYFYSHEFSNVTFKRVVVKRVDGKIVYKLVHSKVPGLFIKYDCFSSICLEGGTILISSWPSKLTQKANLQNDVSALIFFELVPPSGVVNVIKKYLPVAIRLHSLLKKKHGKVEWDILSTNDRKLMNCSGFESFHSLPISCKNAFPKSTWRSKSADQRRLQVDEKTNHALQRKQRYLNDGKDEDESSSTSTSEEIKQLSPSVISNENKSDSLIVQFFRPLEIRLICPPFSGAIAENNRCLCPKGKVNVLEKCVSAKKAKADGYPQSSFQSEILPIVPTKVIMDNSHFEDYVTKYVCPDYSRASMDMDGKKCVCPQGHVMKKRVCSPNQDQEISSAKTYSEMQTTIVHVDLGISQRPKKHEKVKVEGKLLKASNSKSTKSAKRDHNYKKNYIGSEKGRSYQKINIGRSAVRKRK